MYRFVVFEQSLKKYNVAGGERPAKSSIRVLLGVPTVTRESDSVWKQ
jgi:hypothetical protein